MKRKNVQGPRATRQLVRLRTGNRREIHRPLCDCATVQRHNCTTAHRRPCGAPGRALAEDGFGARWRSATGGLAARARAGRRRGAEAELSRAAAFGRCARAPAARVARAASAGARRSRPLTGLAAGARARAAAGMAR
jgi:hypothetical protein